MSREVRRVPSGFDWPLNKTWEGYFMPEFLQSKECVACEGYGYSPEARRMKDQWYGNVPFSPRETGSTPFPHTHPTIQAYAERNVTSAPEYYGTDHNAVDREARRLARLWNGQWSHHLGEDDLKAQLDGKYALRELTHVFVKGEGWVLREPQREWTAAEVNEKYLGSFMGGPDQYVAVSARCKREGVPLYCPDCDGKGSLEKFKGQRKAAKKWKPVKPPKGNAWQIWETVSEGSPVTPAFDTPEELAKYWTRGGGDYENALAWITGPGWAPSAVIVNGVVKTSEDVISEGGL